MATALPFILRLKISLICSLKNRFTFLSGDGAAVRGGAFGAQFASSPSPPEKSAKKDKTKVVTHEASPLLEGPERAEK